MTNFFILFFPEVIQIGMALFTLFLFIFVRNKLYLPASFMFRLKDFFRLRDEFILRIADGKSKEDDFLVNHFVSSINVFIRNGKKMDLDLIINEMADSEKSDNKEEMRKIKEALDSSDEEMKILVKEYYNSAIRFFVFNSSIGTLLKIVFKVFGLLSAIAIYSLVLNLVSFFNPNAKRRMDFISNSAMML